MAPSPAPPAYSPWGSSAETWGRALARVLWRASAALRDWSAGAILDPLRCPLGEDSFRDLGLAERIPQAGRGSQR